MGNTTTTTPTRSTKPTVSKYAVPDPQEAWERFDRLVRQAMGVSVERLEHYKVDYVVQNNKQEVVVQRYGS